MKRKWALGLCEGLMTQAVLSLPEMTLFFSPLVGFCLIIMGSRGREDREKGNKEKAILAFYSFF